MVHFDTLIWPPWILIFCLILEYRSGPYLNFELTTLARSIRPGASSPGRDPNPLQAAKWRREADVNVGWLDAYGRTLLRLGDANQTDQIGIAEVPGTEGQH